eukprot:1011147_1
MLVHHGLDIDAVMRPHEKVEARTGTVGRKAESTEAFVLSDDALRVEEPMAEVSREPEVNLPSELTDYLDRLAADKHENSQITNWPQFVQEIRPVAAALVAEFGAYALHTYETAAYAEVDARVIEPVERLARSAVRARIYVAHHVYDQLRGRLADLNKRYREVKLGKQVGKALRCKNELQKVIVEKLFPLNREIYSVLSGCDERSLHDQLSGVNLSAVRNQAVGCVSDAENDIEMMKFRNDSEEESTLVEDVERGST